MLEQAKAFVKRREFLWNSAQLIRWYSLGRPVPPPHVVKQRAIRAQQRRSGARVLIETGTYRGDMLAAMSPYFERLYSIELSEELCRRARERFVGDSRITVLQGDSGVALAGLLEMIAEPCVFWLDGHYSGGITAKGAKESPIVEELRCIKAHHCKTHVLLIDDARCFHGPEAQAPYAEIMRGVAAINPRYRVSVRNDIIIATVA